MTDLFRMLDENLIDFVFGVADDSIKRTSTRAFLYEEPLFYIPQSEDINQNRQTVTVDDIAGKTIVMVPDGCGLAKATRAIFRSHRCKFKQYPGEAMSYQMLEEWASLGLGAAILPQSRFQKSKAKALPIVDKSGKPLMLTFESIWKDDITLTNLIAFSEHITEFATQGCG